MAHITTARSIAGASFADLPDDEIASSAAYVERITRRPLSAAYAAIFRDFLAARRVELQKAAGVQPQQFVPEMYGATKTVGDSIRDRGDDESDEA